MPTNTKHKQDARHTDRARGNATAFGNAVGLKITVTEIELYHLDDVIRTHALSH
jgi:hypothetical protein